MIAQNITTQIGDALRAHDEMRLGLLRMLSSALSYEKIKLQHELSDDEEITVVRREVKKRNDAIESYNLSNDKEKAGEKIKLEKSEIEILKEYLPPEVDDVVIDAEVKKAIEETGASEMKDMGKVMALLKTKLGNTVDGGRLSAKVKSALYGS